MSLSLILLAAALTGCTVAYVISPLLWLERAADDAPETDALREAREMLSRAYAALRELEADHRLGKLEPREYGAVRAELEDEAARQLRRIDWLTPKQAAVEGPRLSKVARRAREHTR